jgi:hypothetical protein
MARRPPAQNSFYEVLNRERHRFDADDIVRLFGTVNQQRVEVLSGRLFEYISTNLPAAFENRNGLIAYRSNPYVLMTSASVMDLGDPARFADFLFNTKLYMALETSFGKSVEAACLEQYPLNSADKWIEAPEKIAEFAALEGLSREERARRRTLSAWREIDKSVVVGHRRYLTSIKSGPNTINDTQVQAMTAAIAEHHRTWAQRSRETYPHVEELDIVIGLTYGTNRTTNNKENQILVKLLEHGFEEEDRARRPGVLIDQASHSVRVYRRIGKDFWAFIGDPGDPSRAEFVFLEILLALAKALAAGIGGTALEDRINQKIRDLAAALARLQFPRNSLPEWIRADFTDDQLFWFATAMTAFYDEGI